VTYLSNTLKSQCVWPIGVCMNTNTLLILGAFLVVAILYIMRRRVRQGRKKGTF